MGRGKSSRAPREAQGRGHAVRRAEEGADIVAPSTQRTPCAAGTLPPDGMGGGTAADVRGRLLASPRVAPVRAALLWAASAPTAAPANAAASVRASSAPGRWCT